MKKPSTQLILDRYVDICARKLRSKSSPSDWTYCKVLSKGADQLIMYPKSGQKIFFDQKHTLQNNYKATAWASGFWLLATLSRAKAITGPSPMAQPGLAEKGPAWPGSWLWAGPGKSLTRTHTMPCSCNGPLQQVLVINKVLLSYRCYLRLRHLTSSGKLDAILFCLICLLVN